MFPGSVKMNKLFFIFCLGFFVASFALASASVGVGISPTKVVYQIEAGSDKQFDLTVFNSGDTPLEVSLTVDGTISEFTDVSNERIVIQPEPTPHALPIKNGKSLSVTFSPRGSLKSGTYTGTISATGSPGEGSQFGGSVAVATQVEIIIVPAASFLSRIPSVYLYGMIGLLAVIVIIYTLHRMGFTINVARAKKE